MPPKKKDEKGKASEPADTADEQKVAMETELLVSILKSRLGRYQEAGEKLAVEGFRLSDELAKQKLTLQDINEFLTNELKARSVATTQLEERVLELNKQMQDVQKEAQAELGRIRAEAAAQVLAAEGRVESLAAQLDGNAEFLDRREQLEAQLVGLKEQLAAKQKEAEQKLSDMERRHLQDKEKMKQEMTTKIRETKLTMAQLADQHLESSTKRTLVENEAMAAELAYHSAQSSRLAEANNTLRAEAAEMRRQLAIAQKTVESTARKNLLLQQTIKAILKCLQEEGSAAATAVTTVAAAAGSAQQLQDCVSFTLRDPAADVVAFSQALQHQQQEEGQQHGLAASGNSLDSARATAAEGYHGLSSTGVLPQEQQQKQEAGSSEALVGAGVAADIVEQLEHQVVNLSDELDAAKQALAAALQGLIPEGEGGPISVVYNRPQQQQQQGLLTVSTDHVRAGLTTPKFSPSYCSSGPKASPCYGPTTAAAVPGSPSGSSSSKSGPSTGRGRSRNRSRSPATSKMQQGSAGWGTTFEGGWAGTCSARAGAAAAAMEAALEDGVAAFVLYCVQQLRRGSSPATAATPIAGKDGSSRASPPSSSSEAFGIFAADSNSVGTSTCSSPTGKSRQPGKGAAAAAVSMRSVSPSMLGLGFNAQSLIGYALADGGDAAVAAATDAAACAASESALREHLVRLLLDQLHGYTQQKVAAFQGIQLIIPALASVASDKQQQQQQQGELDLQQCQSAGVPQTSEGTVVKDSSRGTHLVDSSLNDSDSISQLLQEGPPDHPLLLLLPGASSGPSSSRSSVASPQGLVRTPGALAGLQVLPPLPSLLGMVQQQRSQASISSPASTATQSHPAAANTSAAGDRYAATRSSTEDLFGALLSDLRPWGASIATAGSKSPTAEGSSSSLHKDRGGRSPSPLGQSSQLIGGSVPSPKPFRQAPVMGLRPGGVGFGSLSNSSSCSSISAGRLVKAGEAAGGTASGLHHGSNLGKKTQQQQSSGLPVALQLSAVRPKSPTE